MADPYVAANEWADAPSSSVSAPRSSPPPGLDDPTANAWADAAPLAAPPPLDPKEIAARDHLDLAPSPESSSPAEDLGLERLPAADEDAQFRSFEVPDPVLLTDAELGLRGYVWVSAKNGDIPEFAVEAGHVVRRSTFGGSSKEAIYVARVKHGVAIVPGKAASFLGGCNYGLGDGEERVAKSYQVLTHPRPPTKLTHTWLPLPPTAASFRNLVSASLRSPKGDQLGVARARHSDGYHVGFVLVPPEGGDAELLVVAPWGGKEIRSEVGEVLVVE
ncbi:hypothetical protein DFJ74DRAFT_650318 [Hyaloraphidium curvatum]|nr:hypothetical protein DFJ74DRAFT_650318 [Hyaloraphidium curvatum]